jgi:hypothetical protein
MWVVGGYCVALKDRPICISCLKLGGIASIINDGTIVVDGHSMRWSCTSQNEVRGDVLGFETFAEAKAFSSIVIRRGAKEALKSLELGIIAGVDKSEINVTVSKHIESIKF